MKRLVSLLMIAMLVLAACASATAQAALPNPMVEVENVQAIEQQLGLSMPLPSSARTAKCYIIGDALGQVDFDFESANYTLRGQLGEAPEDISGLHMDFTTVESIEFDEITVTFSLNDGSAGMAQWYGDGTSYALTVAEGASQEMLIEAILKILYEE